MLCYASRPRIKPGTSRIPKLQASITQAHLPRGFGNRTLILGRGGGGSNENSSVNSAILKIPLSVKGSFRNRQISKNVLRCNWSKKKGSYMPYWKCEQIPGVSSAWRLNLFRRRPIFVGPQYGSCFTSHLWRPEFGGKFVQISHFCRDSHSKERRDTNMYLASRMGKLHKFAQISHTRCQVHISVASLFGVRIMTKMQSYTFCYRCGCSKWNFWRKVTLSGVVTDQLCSDPDTEKAAILPLKPLSFLHF